MPSQKIIDKLTKLPSSAGVYYFKDKSGEIIYVGKAAVLKNRVRQYFQKSKTRDPKTDALIGDIFDFDWMEVDSEMEALFLEAEMIKRYKAKYNILMRDDKSLSYIRIDYNSNFPTVSITRRPLDDGAKYFGPYFSTISVRQALKILRKIFPYATRSFSQQKRANLHYHLGLDPGLEEGRTTLKDYRANLRKLMAVIQGKKPKILKELEKDMKKASTTHNYETAAKIRNRINYLKSLDKQVIFSDKEFLDISKDHALSEIVNLLSLSKFPLRIEGFDISHMQGTDVVASMVVFTNGVSDKAKYRKFKTKLNKNDDFYNMNETIKRRFSEKNLNAWGNPDLVLIDGGKGQLDAAINALAEVKTLKVPIIGLAKRQEQIVINMNSSNVLLSEKYLKNLNGYSQESNKFQILNLPKTSNLVKLLQRIRDESHRFAVSYHSSLKVKRQTKSKLEDIPGIGPITRKKILKQFGQINSLEIEEFNQLEKLIGKAKTNSIKEYISVK